MQFKLKIIFSDIIIYFSGLSVNFLNKREHSYFIVCSSFKNFHRQRKSEKAHFKGRAGVFSWRNFFVTRDLKVLRDPRRTWIPIVPLAWFWDASSPNGYRRYRDLSMRFAIWSLDVAIRVFASFKHCFLSYRILLSYFRDSGKRNFYIRDSWFSIFQVGDTPSATLDTLSTYVRSLLQLQKNRYKFIWRHNKNGVVLLGFLAGGHFVYITDLFLMLFA